jgi:catechol 2,3-dioxygenase-like lactoylglutathione lyase family enzyme
MPKTKTLARSAKPSGGARPRAKAKTAKKKPVAKAAIVKKSAKKRPAPAAKVKTSAKAVPVPRVVARVAPPAPTPPMTRAERRRRFPEALRLRGMSAALTVNDLERSIDFYVKGLGFTISQRWERDGKLNGVMLVAGSCEIGLAQDDWAKGRDRVKGVGVSFYAETGQSLDLIASLAREHGIEPDGPKKAPWGTRIVEFVDPDGFKLTIHWPM